MIEVRRRVGVEVGIAHHIWVLGIMQKLMAD